MHTCKKCQEQVVLPCADTADCILGNAPVMSPDRIKEINSDMEASLTDKEMNAGWFFCNFEWDGMLLHEDSPEAKICGNVCACQPTKT